jgi:hypothetical protein
VTASQSASAARFGRREVRRVAPGRDGEEALVGLAQLPCDSRVAVDADAAAVDLARAQAEELDETRGQAGLRDGAAQ